MELLYKAALIVLTSGCISLVGHSWIKAFFAKKEELINRFKLDLEESE